MSRPRDAKKTRQAILQAAFENIHKKGFQPSGLSEILAATGVTKGALYHHFPNKTALGHAVVDEVVREYVENLWLLPLESAKDPVEALAQLIERRLTSKEPDIVKYGCPLHNLAQEMGPVDEGFRQRLDGLFRIWRKGVAKALRAGQQRGNVRTDLESDEVAAFVIAGVGGALVQAKSGKGLASAQECMAGLSRYLTSLRR